MSGRRIPSRPLLVLVAAFLLVAGCKSADESDPGETGSATTIITPRANADGTRARSEEERLQEEDRFQSLLDQAAMLHVKQDFKESLATIRLALAMNPPEPFGHRLRALEIKVKSDILRRSYLDAFVRFDRPWHTIGETIEGEIVLMNISDRELVVPASRLVELPAEARTGADDESNEVRTVIRSVMTYREFLPGNTIITNRRTENFGVAEDIRLLPGETFRIPVAIDSAEINVGGRMYRRYSIACSLHAVEIRVGDEVFHGAVDFRTAAVGVFPRNAEHLADAPMERVRQALAKSSDLHLSLAAAFIAPEDADARRAYEELARAELSSPEALPRMQDAIMCGLAILADDENTRTKDEWIEWLKKRLDR